MPKVEVELKSVNQIKGLRGNKVAMAQMDELIRITDRVKKAQDRAGELRLELYDTLTETMEDEPNKSVEYKGHRFTAIQGEGQRRLDKAKLAKYIPVDKLEKCYTQGEPPRPTVSVNRISEVKAKSITDRVIKKLRKGLDNE